MGIYITIGICCFIIGLIVMGNTGIPYWQKVKEITLQRKVDAIGNELEIQRTITGVTLYGYAIEYRNDFKSITWYRWNKHKVYKTMEQAQDAIKQSSDFKKYDWLIIPLYKQSKP